MEIEPLISGSRWTMLKHLAEKPCSPTELAEKLGTTLANVSQQLRMLELAGIVEKKSQHSREKGKPRMLFYLSGRLAYLSILTSECSEKKLIHIDKHKEALIKIWLLTKEAAHRKLEAFCSSAESVQGISLYAEPNSGKLFAVCRDKQAEKKLLEIKTELEVVIGEEKKVPSNYIKLIQN
ncbi:MAG: winged helix-turn-helix domain-containing protein [Candidatus Woesearchaeota archaeon]